MSTSQGNPNISNARDLVERILVHPQGGIAALLQLAEDQETDWLEFKAALHPEGGIFKPGEKPGDYHWHVAKAVVALANTGGGAVILGLDDNLHPVGLAASDPKGTLERKGREAFNRGIVLPAVTKGIWKTGECDSIQVEGGLTSLVEIQNADYQGHPLAVILVAPTPDDLLEVCERRNNQKRQFVPVRRFGAVGEVCDLHGLKEPSEHQRIRKDQFRSDRYAQLWARFVASLPTEGSATQNNFI